MCASLLYDMDYDDFVAGYKKGDTKLVKIREDEIKPMVSFGLTYGREADALAEDMGWPVERARRFKQKYFEIFSGIAKKTEEIRDFAKIHGYVVNMTGRIRRLSVATLTGFEYTAARERALRQAVNFIIQSSTHDLVMKAMGEIAFWFNELELKSKLIGEVHDSVIVDAYKPELETVLRIMRNSFDLLEDYYSWVTIPMVTEIKGGPNLLEMKDIE
jgi:DNA polymerase-1